MYFRIRAYFKKGDIIEKLDYPMEINPLTHEKITKIKANEDCVDIEGLGVVYVSDIKEKIKQAKKRRNARLGS